MVSSAGSNLQLWVVVFFQKLITAVLTGQKVQVLNKPTWSV